MPGRKTLSCKVLSLACHAPTGFARTRGTGFSREGASTSNASPLGSQILCGSVACPRSRRLGESYTPRYRSSRASLAPTGFARTPGTGFSREGASTSNAYPFGSQSLCWSEACPRYRRLGESDTPRYRSSRASLAPTGFARTRGTGFSREEASMANASLSPCKAKAAATWIALTAIGISFAGGACP
jgi:uncharacterized protein (DUF2237 family)